MPNFTPKTNEPALILKPLPDCDATERTAVQFGGLPQLPTDMDWPCRLGVPYTFFAQIDLEKLPRCVQGHTRDYLLPPFPEVGTLFIFMALDIDAIESRLPPRVLFAEKDVTGISERAPPKNLPDLHKHNEFVDQQGISSCGTLLRRQQVEVLSYLSSQAENPLARNILRSKDSSNIDARNVSDDAQRFSLAKALVRKPGQRYSFDPPEGYQKMWRTAGMPSTFLEIERLRDFDLNWEFVEHFVRELSVSIFDRLKDEVNEIRMDVPRRDRLPAIELRIDEVYGELPRQSESNRIQARYFPIPEPDGFIDDQLIHWAQLAMGSSVAMSEEQKVAFVSLFERIERDAVSKEPLCLGVLWGNTPSRMNAKVVRDFACQALETLKTPSVPPKNKYSQRTWDEKVVLETTMPPMSEAQICAAKANSIPIQMFGAGYVLQSAAIDHADKVLLLQIGDRFGSSVNFEDSGILFQLWIDKENLAAGSFDDVVATFEAT